MEKLEACTWPLEYFAITHIHTIIAAIVMFYITGSQYYWQWVLALMHVLYAFVVNGSWNAELEETTDRVQHAYMLTTVLLPFVLLF